MKKHIDPLPRPYQYSAASYMTGFLLAAALTSSAFLLTWAYIASDGAVFARGWLLAFLSVLATLQLCVQALFFLHVSAERRARLNLYSGIFTVLVVLTIVIGSIWIMQNLNYHMMPQDASHYIQQTEGIHHE